MDDMWQTDEHAKEKYGNTFKQNSFGATTHQHVTHNSQPPQCTQLATHIERTQHISHPTRNI